ncbi:MAG: P-loop NTPase fold protein [Thermoplasmatales archaeon]|nr:P-loop NTPase fold protein [Candidatus Thermoplasmatota archaeon]MCL6002138.1 P-loop NTPase fold protein [Candidatus Thermoplasmatota archaeon]MDA8056180.1 P-loop NTPase fold protein [Thermoplasmatales archaeon]
MPKLSELISSAELGNRRDIGKLITIMENRSEGYSDLLRRIKKKRSRTYVVGITGPPGVGKSSLISRLASEFSKREKLAIVMIDATSPYSGGSLLGNRLRLESTDNTYVRSMATRGSTGGLNLALGDSLDLLSFLGFTMILVESVGTGQDETDILHYSDKILMVLSPGMGDQVQAIKAGQMEIGDFIVLNKADKPESIIAEKELMETISIPDLSKKHRLVKVSALTGEGIGELAEAIISTRNESDKGDSNLSKEKERIRREILAILRSKDRMVEEYAKQVSTGEITREEAVTEILKQIQN